MTAQSTRQLETLQEAADRLRVHPRTLRRRIAAGSLNAYRIGTVIRLDPAEVDALLRPIPSAGRVA